METWVLTVSGLITSSAAISLLSLPSTTRLSTSRSRLVSVGRSPASEAGGGSRSRTRWIKTEAIRGESALSPAAAAAIAARI